MSVAITTINQKYMAHEHRIICNKNIIATTKSLLSINTYLTMTWHQMKRSLYSPVYSVDSLLKRIPRFLPLVPPALVPSLFLQPNALTVNR